MVARAVLEPARAISPEILSLLRLPIPSSDHFENKMLRAVPHVYIQSHH